MHQCPGEIFTSHGIPLSLCSVLCLSLSVTKVSILQKKPNNLLLCILLASEIDGI